MNLFEILSCRNRAVSWVRAEWYDKADGRFFFLQLLCERAELLLHTTWQAYTNITLSQIFRRVSVIATFRQVNCERTVIIA